MSYQNNELQIKPYKDGIRPESTITIKHSYPIGKSLNVCIFEDGKAAISEEGILLCSHSMDLKKLLENIKQKNSPSYCDYCIEKLKEKQ